MLKAFESCACGRGLLFFFFCGGGGSLCSNLRSCEGSEDPCEGSYTAPTWQLRLLGRGYKGKSPYLLLTLLFHFFSVTLRMPLTSAWEVHAWLRTVQRHDGVTVYLALVAWRLWAWK